MFNFFTTCSAGPAKTKSFFNGRPVNDSFAITCYILGDLFAFLAIFISCLRLFGLSAYVAESRIKEIGVRKVLGASVFSITKLLSLDFVKLVIVSLVIATPVSWYAMNKWLQDYNYRVTIGWEIFVVAGILAVTIALITVSFQSIKAAVSNPVNSLRTE